MFRSVSILIKGNVCLCACLQCPDESITLTAMKFGTQVPAVKKKAKILKNGVNVSGDPQEKTEIEEQIETCYGYDIPTNDKVASKHRQKPAKKKGKKESAEDEDKEESSKVEEEAKPKDLPAKRGIKPARVQNGVDSTKDKQNHETKTDVEAKDLPRSRRRVKADVEPSNSVKDQNKLESKETKAKTTRKKQK
ncbi:hypothetical protein AVEN_144689-1 [Araneus ventricosus]|uniref:Uncharacterized protein n=1 Tax=Araneus ventricosus TaxID=182803 RepID=A0A4Y2I723_ARAVE|nr:hypothetical protein AVEN_144689-1 [Araneus ventricosus]